MYLFYRLCTSIEYLILTCRLVSSCINLIVIDVHDILALNQLPDSSLISICHFIKWQCHIIFIIRFQYLVSLFHTCTCLSINSHIQVTIYLHLFMWKETRHSYWCNRRQATKHTLHLRCTLLIQFQSTEKFLCTLISKSIGNNNNDSLLSIVASKIMLIEIFLLRQICSIHYLICEILIPLRCYLLQICIRINILYSLSYIREFTVIFNLVICIIKPSIIWIYQIRLFLIICNQCLNITRKLHKWYRLHHQIRILDSRIFILVSFAIMICLRHSLVSYLSNIKSINLCI